jgi:branched-subunit amino acid transport protein
MNETDLHTLLTIVGMTVVTIVTRSFFFLSGRPLHLPQWVRSGMQYAPIAALAAVIAPELVMAHGELIASWKDARLFGAAAGIACFYWRRNVLGTIMAGMAVYLPLHIYLGW